MTTTYPDGKVLVTPREWPDPQVPWKESGLKGQESYALPVETRALTREEYRAIYGI